MSTVSLAMICKDEEAGIGACLESARPFIDQFVILDTGSTDRTKEIIAETLDGVPGEVFDGEFINFGVTRSVLMAHANATDAEYILLLDADMVLTYEPFVPTLPGTRFPPLTEDVYEGRIKTGPIDYTLPFLVRNDRAWRYDGVIHSYLACDDPWSSTELTGLRIIDGSHVTREKLLRDLELGREYVSRNPLDARHVFYLAQTYYDLDMHHEAIAMYRVRANLPGWDEETFYARYRLGALLCEHVSFAEGAKELLAAWEMRPSRIEPLRVLANVANSVADKYPLPPDRLFVGYGHYRAPEPEPVAEFAIRAARSEVEEIFFHRYTPKPGDTVVELGAAEGTETGILADLVGPSGRVIAVEAHPVTFAELSVEHGDRDNVMLLQFAVVANASRPVRISDDPAPWHNRVGDDGIEVQAVTLDRITETLPQVDLLKINIEGSEADVLAASPETLAKTRHVVVSCHDFVGMPTLLRVVTTLKAAGFDVQTHDAPTIIDDGHDGRCLGDYLYAKRLLRPDEVSAVIVTRGDVPLGPTLEVLPFSDVRIWDNSDREDLKTYGRVKILDEVDNEIVFSVDDDVIFTDFDRLLEAYEPGLLVCNMDADWIKGAGYGDWHHLTGAGSIYDRAIPIEATERYLAEFPMDDEFLTWCDAVVGTLAPGKRVDLGYEVRDFSDGPGRLWTTPGNPERKWWMIDRCRAMMAQVAA